MQRCSKAIWNWGKSFAKDFDKRLSYWRKRMESTKSRRDPMGISTFQEAQTRVSQSPSVPLALSLRRLIRRPVALILCLSGLDHLASSSEVRVSHRARLPSSQSSTRRSLGLGLYM
nr:uncharacterized protein LOC109167502 [Ipomoea batatas]